MENDSGMYFSTNLLPNSWAWIRQTKYIVMMTKEESTKIVNFMTPGQGFSARTWSYFIFVNMHYLLIYQYAVTVH